LEAIEGKPEAEGRGAIVLRLRALGSAEAGTIANRSAQLDIERSGVTHAAAIADGADKATAMAGSASAAMSNLSDGLGNIVSKLDVFMRIADGIAKVNRFHSSVIFLTFFLGPSVCGPRLESNIILL